MFWSDADRCFVAEVPDAPGCMAHGDTREEALREIQIALTAYLELMLEDGYPLPVRTEHIPAGHQQGEIQKAARKSIAQKALAA